MQRQIARVSEALSRQRRVEIDAAIEAMATHWTRVGFPPDVLHAMLRRRAWALQGATPMPLGRGLTDAERHALMIIDMAINAFEQAAWPIGEVAAAFLSHANEEEAAPLAGGALDDDPE